jgi:methylmalonyl-CoA mutase
MPDGAPNAAPLNIAREFPAVPTAAWEAAIAQDLQGAEYERKLVWRTEEGLSIRPYYRKEDLAGLEGQLTHRRQTPGWEMVSWTEPGEDAVRADLLHEAGAHCVQELGYAMAAGADRLSALSAKKPLDAAAGELEFVFAVGTSYFLEIAKLRAARLLWIQIVAAFGSANPAACNMRVHVRTSRRNKSIYDCYTNLLRAATEALSAVIGGCDKLTIEPFGFAPHLALNIQRILREEAHLDAVADPAGGSYYIESLTDSMAREAWTLFQQVEAEGGYPKVLKSGSVARALAATRAAREKLFSNRRRTLVGVNNYPNLMESEPGAPAPASCGLDLPQHRIAEPFEKMRQQTIEQAHTLGRNPRVLLLKRGDVKMKGARASFCLNFFGCAGFEMVESEELDGIHADLIVLCSSDPEYLEFANDVCPKAKIPVWVAGNPKEQIPALREAGIQGFIHMQSDMIETLTDWQNRLGTRSGE